MFKAIGNNNNTSYSGPIIPHMQPPDIKNNLLRQHSKTQWWSIGGTTERKKQTIVSNSFYKLINPLKLTLSNFFFNWQTD